MGVCVASWSWWGLPCGCEIFGGQASVRRDVKRWFGEAEQWSVFFRSRWKPEYVRFGVRPIFIMVFLSIFGEPREMIWKWSFFNIWGIETWWLRVICVSCFYLKQRSVISSSKLFLVHRAEENDSRLHGDWPWPGNAAGWTCLSFSAVPTGGGCVGPPVWRRRNSD